MPAKNWNDYDSYLKPYHLKRGGQSELVTVAHVDEAKVHDPSSHREDTRPTLKFAEYRQPLVVNQGNRRTMIMLFGVEPQAFLSRRLVIAVHKNDGDEGDGTIQIVGEWTDGDTWRRVQRGKDNQPTRVDVVNKPKKAEHA